MLNVLDAGRRVEDMVQWIADVLGPGFEQHTLSLPGGDEATLVRCTEPPVDVVSPFRNVDVLYIHGWSDYFFQKDLARFWASRGARFFALDLRRYGRSLRPGQVPGFITDLADYGQEIDAALRVMASEPGIGAVPRELVLLGHSTGGLTASIWAANNPGRVSALVLNSPWLEFQASGVVRSAVAPLLAAGSRINPARPLPTIDSGIYTRAVSTAFGGEWDYNLQWRPEQGFTLTPGFLNAVFTAQAKVARKLNIDGPVLVMLSQKSYLNPRWSENAKTADVALNVQAVAARAPDLGSEVCIRRFSGAFHDIFLSPKDIRESAYSAMGRWTQNALDTDRFALWSTM